jgi:hypothetical protein
MRLLSIQYASGTDAYSEHIYASVSGAYAQHKRKNSKFEKVPSNYADHARKELMRALSRN